MNQLGIQTFCKKLKIDLSLVTTRQRFKDFLNSWWMILISNLLLFVQCRQSYNHTTAAPKNTTANLSLPFNRQKKVLNRNSQSQTPLRHTQIVYLGLKHKVSPPIQPNCKLWCGYISQPFPVPLLPLTSERTRKRKERDGGWSIDWLIPDAIPEQSGLDEWDPRNPGDVDKRKIKEEKKQKKRKNPSQRQSGGGEEQWQRRSQSTE